jgi:transposase
MFLFLCDSKMSKKKSIDLSQTSKSTLWNIFKRDPNPRRRERAQTLLLLDQGMSRHEVADQQDIHVRTVGSTLNQWLKEGVLSLSDKPRCGAPSKISLEERNHLKKLASEEPLSARNILEKHIENGGEKVHLNTVIRTLKNLNLTFKRTRHSLKKKEIKSRLT